MFSRRSSAPIETPDEVSAVEAAVVDTEMGRKGQTPSKGRPTPKRSANQSRKVVEAPPTNRRDAAKRARELRATDRAEQRAGMDRGDERYLLARDRGPERRLTRDLVDSRRTVGTWFFGAALLILVGGNPVFPPVIQIGSQLLWVAIAILFVIDAFLLCRKVNKLVWERFPKTQQRKLGLFLYAIMRSITFRRLRIPKPAVSIGTKV